MLIRVLYLMDKLCVLGDVTPIAFDVIKTSGGDSYTRKGCVNLICYGNAGRANARVIAAARRSTGHNSTNHASSFSR